MAVYSRRETVSVRVGATTIGGQAPIRLQSMTTAPTMDTRSCVDQAIRIIEAGGELVRMTAQGRREALNMQNIKEELKARGYDTPLVADVHFNPDVADVAAQYVEKVRINPVIMLTLHAPSNIWNIPMPSTLGRLTVYMTVLSRSWIYAGCMVRPSA